MFSFHFGVATTCPSHWIYIFACVFIMPAHRRYCNCVWWALFLVSERRRNRSNIKSVVRWIRDNSNIHKSISFTVFSLFKFIHPLGCEDSRVFVFFCAVWIECARSLFSLSAYSSHHSLAHCAHPTSTSVWSVINGNSLLIPILVDLRHFHKVTKRNKQKKSITFFFPVLFCFDIVKFMQRASYFFRKENNWSDHERPWVRLLS